MRRLVFLLFGVGLVLSGCGGGSGDGSLTTVGEADSAGDPEEINPVALARSAMGRSEAATSLRGDMEMKMTGLADMGDFTLRMSLEVAANGDTAVTSFISEGTREAFGLGDPTEQRSEMRFVDDLVYVSFPQEMMEEIADTPWASFDIDELTDVDLENLSPINTYTYLSYLAGINDKATVTQGEDVNGISATRISGKYTMSALLDSLPEDQRQATIDSQQFFSGMADDDIRDMMDALEMLPIQLDVWIDQDNYIVRQRIVIDEWYEFLFSVDPSARESKDEIENIVQTMDIYFYDYGAPITIIAPPENDVTHLQGSFADSLL